jgi:hypothetical protein
LEDRVAVHSAQKTKKTLQTLRKFPKNAKAEEDVAAGTEKGQNEEGKRSVDRDQNGGGNPKSTYPDPSNPKPARQNPENEPERKPQFRFSFA